jgi:hypothetical protein
MLIALLVACFLISVLLKNDMSNGFSDPLFSAFDIALFISAWRAQKIANWLAYLIFRLLLLLVIISLSATIWLSNIWHSNLLYTAFLIVLDFLAVLSLVKSIKKTKD